MFGSCTLVVETNPGDKSLVVKGMGNTEPIFKVKYCNTATHCQREVLDEKEHPLFMLQKQIATLHARCDGYGTSSDDITTFGKKLYTISKNYIRHKYTNLNVKLLDTFLDKCVSLEMEEHGALLNDLLNTGFSLENEALITDVLEKGVSLEDKEKDNCKILGSWSKKALTIFKGSTVIAKVRPLDTNDKFMVDVSSDVDRAFVISLIAAVDCMRDPGTLKHAGKAFGFVLKAAAGAAFAAGGQAGYGLLSS